MTSKVDILVDHYHRTFEVALKTWEQRNQTFLTLLGVVGGAALLTFNAPEAQPLLVDLLAKVLSISEPSRKQQLIVSFPYGLVQSILLMVIMYLTLVLFHRTTSINRSYRYLEALETEIRTALELSSNDVAFTREGKFYWRKRPILSRVVGVAYAGTLGCLLFAFLGMRLVSDFKLENYGVAIIDCLLSLLTLLFYFAYAFDSVHIRSIAQLTEKLRHKFFKVRNS